MNDLTTEQAIQAAGANVAPRITPADIEASIASESYFTAADGVIGASTGKPGASLLPEYATHAGAPLTLLTFCVLVTRNGHTVAGEAHCQDPAKFSAEIGREEARKDAIRKLWPMVVYAERSKPAQPNRYTRKDVVSIEFEKFDYGHKTLIVVKTTDGKRRYVSPPAGHYEKGEELADYVLSEMNKTTA